MKTALALAMFIVILSSVLGKPVDRMRSMTDKDKCGPITSLLEGNLILRGVTQSSPSLIEAYIKRMLSAVESICEVLDYFKHTDDPNPIGPSNSSCLNSSDSASSVIVSMIRTRTCTWLNSWSKKILPNCKSQALEVDLFCHEVRLRSFSQKIANILPGGSRSISVVLVRWVLENVNRDQLSVKALQLICRHVRHLPWCINI